MTTFSGFAKKMAQVSKNFEANSERVSIRMAEGFTKKVIEHTPVDTGRAVSNWTISIGAPQMALKEPYIPGNKGSTAEANRKAAEAEARRVAASYKSRSEVFVTNSVSYIADLERGTSKKAPYGMIDFGFLEAARILYGSNFLKYNGVIR